MRSEWAKASICALSSRSEGFPLQLQEAMAAGVPCVSFDCASGPREIVEHEVNGLLVTPESVGGLSAALLRLASDDDLRAKLGQGALDSSAAYDADAIAAQWVAIFERARSPRGPAGPGSRRCPPSPRVRCSTAPSFERARQTPAHVRHLALAALVECARATGDEWLVIPPHERESAVVVVPADARHRFLAALADADLPPYLSLRDPANAGWHERRGVVSELARELQRGRTPVVVLEPWPLGPDGLPRVVGQGCSVEVEFWETNVEGQLVAPRLNPYTQRIPRGIETVEHEVEGVTVRTLPLMTEPTVDECTFPVDVVYTWVDGNDPVWNRAREERLAALSRHGRRRDRADPRVERPGPVRLPRRAPLLAAQRPPLRPVGTPDPPGHRRAGPRLARRRPPVDPPGRPHRRSFRRTRCRRSTRTRSRPRCT